jgi:hypothetical protein
MMFMRANYFYNPYDLSQHNGVDGYVLALDAVNSSTDPGASVFWAPMNLDATPPTIPPIILYRVHLPARASLTITPLSVLKFLDDGEVDNTALGSFNFSGSTLTSIDDPQYGGDPLHGVTWPVAGASSTTWLGINMGANVWVCQPTDAVLNALHCQTQ